MPNVIVSIGRNVGSEPMENTEWDLFKGLLRNAVYRRTGNIYFIGEGKGYYNNTTEDSFTIIGELHGSAENLKRELAEMAKDFRQECIAVTVADADLVAAR